MQMPLQSRLAIASPTFSTSSNPRSDTVGKEKRGTMNSVKRIVLFVAFALLASMAAAQGTPVPTATAPHEGTADASRASNVRSA